MATGFGVDATKSGSVVTSGLTALDVRKINGALYTPGIISGGYVSRSVSALTYTIQAGVVAIQTATDNIVLAPFPATVLTATTPSSGSRLDIIYVKQNFPADGDSNVVLGYATSLPPNAVEIARFTMSAGMGNTSAAIQSGTIDFSIPYGAKLPTLFAFNDSYNGVLPDNLTRRGFGYFNLPTDRRIRMSMSATLYAQNAVKFDAAAYCEYYFLPAIDGVDVMVWTTPGLHQAWGTYTWEIYLDVTRGTHAVCFGMGRMTGPGHAATFTGTDGNGFYRNSFVFRVHDEGVIV